MHVVDLEEVLCPVFDCPKVPLVAVCKEPEHADAVQLMHDCRIY
jgi:hypothetical protein